ncbi:MAG: ABC transporter permease [Bacilli bacterium]
MKNNKLSYLVLRSLKQKLTSKWFIVVNILLLIVIPLVINIDSVIKLFGGDFNEPTKILVVDNTKKVYDRFEEIFNSASTSTGVSVSASKVKVEKTDKNIKDLKKKIEDKKNKDIIIEISENDKNIFDAKIISYDYSDSFLYQSIVTSLNTAKSSLALEQSNIDKIQLANIYEKIKIDRTYISKESDANHELMNMISTLVIPIIILPFFFLILIVVQMIGADINEEKSSRSMEIIISSISPTTHFMSKMISINIFVLIQGLLLFAFGGVGLVLRTIFSGSGAGLIESFGPNMVSYVQTFIASPAFKTIIYAIPVTIVLFILSFVAYSLLAGILASMTTNIEDYQQLQTPLMILILIGYYLALMASVYQNSTFIKVFAMIPFISAIVAPSLLVMGQIGIIHVVVAVILLILVIFIFIKYGLRIYKAGILNYSSDKLWKKMFRAAKTKEKI